MLRMGSWIMRGWFRYCTKIVENRFFVFFKQKTAYEMRISDWEFRRVLFRSAALGDQALRAVERIDAELAPAALLHQLFLELHVEEVVPRIALVTAKDRKSVV